MNRRDLERTVRAAFGQCPGCADCHSCRALSLVEMAWDSGRRSGAATSAEKREYSYTWEEWCWEEAGKQKLVAYVNQIAPPQLANVREFVEHELEGASQWAIADGKKKKDWLVFMQGWCRRRIEQMPRLEVQASLFGATKELKRNETRREVGTRLLGR